MEVVDGLPEKQLSFLLRANYDALPTLMNLARWNIIVSAHPTIHLNHVQTGCSIALDQGRWHHDSILLVFVQGKYDLTNFVLNYASVSLLSTMPPNLSLSLSRPDLVLIQIIPLYCLNCQLLSIPNTFCQQQTAEN